MPSFCTSPVTGCADKRRVAATARTRSWLVRHSSTARDRAVNHSPRQWPAGCSVCVCACAPTDDDEVAEPADQAAPGLAARSPENDLLPAASESSPHRAGHVSVCGVPLHESGRDGRPDIRFPTPPATSETTALVRWLQCLRALAAGASNKTPARCCLRAAKLDSLLLPLWCPASPTFAGERVSRIL